MRHGMLIKETALNFFLSWGQGGCQSNSVSYWTDKHCSYSELFKSSTDRQQQKLTCWGSAPFLLWFWMKSTRPCTTVFTATNPFSSCSHVGGGASWGGSRDKMKINFIKLQTIKHANCGGSTQSREFTVKTISIFSTFAILREINTVCGWTIYIGCDLWKKIPCFLPGLGSMLASSSKWGRSLLRLAGSPVLCRAIVSS